MKIVPLACDSLGTRSMATYVETKDVKLVIDPSTALGPRRYGLPPHPIEIKRMEEHWKNIETRMKKADVAVVTHYHYDHHDPDSADIYKNKEVFLKHSKENINKSQMGRAKYFLEQLGDVPKSIEFSDGKEFVFGNTTIRFSEAVPHGINTRYGCVTEVLVQEDDFKFLFTSDIEGPCLEEHLRFIIEQKPDVILSDGPIYFTVKDSVPLMKKVVQKVEPEKYIVEHHLLRDLNWKEKIAEVINTAKKRKVEVLSCAEFLGKENDLLEARRKELYELYPQKDAEEKQKKSSGANRAGKKKGKKK